MKKRLLLLLSIATIGLCFVGCKNVDNKPNEIKEIKENVSSISDTKNNTTESNVADNLPTTVENSGSYEVRYDNKESGENVVDYYIKNGYVTSTYTISKDTMQKALELEKDRILKDKYYADYNNINYTDDFSDIHFYLSDENYKYAISKSEYVADCVFVYQECLSAISTSFDNKNLDIVLNYINTDTNETKQIKYSKDRYENALTDETGLKLEQLIFKAPTEVVEKDGNYEVHFTYFDEKDSNGNRLYNYSEWVAGYFATSVAYMVSE